MSKPKSRYTLLNKPNAITKHYVEGYENFCKLMYTFEESNQEVFVYFSGSKIQSGESWCSNCNKAEKIIESGLTKADANAHFVFVNVGEQQAWFDQKCPFRTDSRTKLFTLPTLMRWKSQQVLYSEQCSDPDLVELLLTEMN